MTPTHASLHSPSGCSTSRLSPFRFFSKPPRPSLPPPNSLPIVDRVEAMAVRSKKSSEGAPHPSLEELLARTDGYLAEARKAIAAARDIITHEGHRT